MSWRRKLDASSLLVLLLASGATAATFVLAPTTSTTATPANGDHAHAHDHHAHQTGELPPLDGTTQATLERFLAIDPDVLAGAHDHGHDHDAADAPDCRASHDGGVRGPGSPGG